MKNVNPQIIGLVDEAIALDLKRKELELEIKNLKDKMDPIKEKLIKEMQRLGRKDLVANKGTAKWVDGRTVGKWDTDKLQKVLKLTEDDLKDQYYIFLE